MKASEMSNEQLIAVLDSLFIDEHRRVDSRIAEIAYRLRTMIPVPQVQVIFEEFSIYVAINGYIVSAENSSEDAFNMKARLESAISTTLEASKEQTAKDVKAAMDKFKQRQTPTTKEAQ